MHLYAPVCVLWILILCYIHDQDGFCGWFFVSICLFMCLYAWMYKALCRWSGSVLACLLTFFCNRCMHCWSESVHAWPACMARPRIDRSLGFNMPMLLQEACCQKNALQLWTCRSVFFLVRVHSNLQVYIWYSYQQMQSHGGIFVECWLQSC